MTDSPNPEVQKDLKSIARLTLDEVKALIQLGKIDPDNTVSDASRCVHEVMQGKSTLDVAAVGLSLVMLGLQLFNQGITSIPSKKGDKDDRS